MMRLILMKVIPGLSVPARLSRKNITGVRRITANVRTVILLPIEGMDANDYAQAGHDLGALLNQAAPSGLLEKLGVVQSERVSNPGHGINKLVRPVARRVELVSVIE